jgi:hypothetical protein
MRGHSVPPYDRAVAAPPSITAGRHDFLSARIPKEQIVLVCLDVVGLIAWLVLALRVRALFQILLAG